MRTNTFLFAIVLMVGFTACKKQNIQPAIAEPTQLHLNSDPPPSDGGEQPDLLGFLVKDANQIPVPNATVQITGQNGSASGNTNAQGKVFFTTTPGSYAFNVVLSGNVVASGNCTKGENFHLETVGLP